MDVNVVLSIDYSNQQCTIESDALKLENSLFFNVLALSQKPVVFTQKTSVLALKDSLGGFFERMGILSLSLGGFLEEENRPKYF